MFRSVLNLLGLLVTPSLYRDSLGRSVLGTSPARRTPPRTIPHLEILEDRTLPSASPWMDQWVQQMAAVQQDYVNAWNTVTQLVRYAQQQWDVVHGITANASNPAPGTTVSQAGAASSSGATNAHEAAPPTMSTSTVKAQVSNSPPLVGGGYLWDPTHGTNASNGLNWDYNGKEQNDPATAKVPGSIGDQVVFDPVATQTLHGNGGSPIT
jgi:hypothetical protein